MELAPDVFVSTLRYGALGADMSVWLATRGRRTVLRFLIETYTREGEYVGFERDIPVRVIKTAGPALSQSHPQNVPLARVFLPRLASLQMLVKTLGELQRSLDIGANSLGTVAVRAGEEKARHSDVGSPLRSVLEESSCCSSGTSSSGARTGQR